MKKGINNIFFGITGQLLILALGILVPRFVLQSYGDEANGLINAIGQLFTYLALIEAGVGQAALQALYGPIVREEHDKTNGILCATQNMFRRLTVVYMLAVVVISVAYPLLLDIKDTETINFFGSSYFAVLMIVLVQGLSNAITFYFVATLKQVLIADGCNYIIVNVTTLIRVLTSLLRIILINSQINLVLLQFVYVVMNIIEVLIYKKVFKRKYSWLNLRYTPDSAALYQKNSFVVHEICNVIFSSTDVFILSVFCDLKIASIYAVYNLAFSALNQLISQIHSGCYYILGQTYNQDTEKYKKVHDAYDTYYIAFVFTLISTAYVMILPFVKLYTADVTNLQYVDKYLPLLFCGIQLLSCCRITSSNLIKLAGHARSTIGRAIIEAVLNLSVSIILVNLIGIYGVLIGTIVALLYRTNDMIIYANKKILLRSPMKTFKTVGINVLVFSFIVVVNAFIDINAINSFPRFFVCAFVICVIVAFIYFALNSLANMEAFSLIKNAMKGIRQSKRRNHD